MNNDAITYEINAANRQYIGFHVQYSSPVEVSFDLQKHHFIRYDNSYRIKFNEKWQVTSSIGVWGELKKNHKRKYPGVWPPCIAESFSVASDYVFLEDLIGVGYYGNQQITFGISFGDDMKYAHFNSWNTLLVKEHFRMSTRAEVDCMLGYHLPDVYPTMVSSFYTYTYLSEYGVFNKSLVADIQERFRLFSHPLLFTNISYYLIGFDEITFLGGNNVSSYNLLGTGILVNFSNPVKMDFVLKTGLFPKNMGITFTANRSF